MSEGQSARDFIDAYRVLDVECHASQEDLRVAYRRQAARHHPDVAEGDPRAATARMQTINLAYGLVARPDVRERYDRLHRAHHGRTTVADAEETWNQLLRTAGRWVGRQSQRRRGGWYRAGYTVGRWLRT